jgi:DNA polymerase
LPRTLHVDFETRSTLDLTVVGLDNYSRHPTTSAWCMGFGFDEDEVGLKAEEGFGNTSGPVMKHVAEGGEVVAHNAPFELSIWNNICVPRYRWPTLRPEQVRCTMAMAYAMALPGSLENAAPAVGITERKDLAGGRLMKQMMYPREVRKCDSCNGKGIVRNSDPCPFCDGKGEDIIWWDDLERREKLYEYCRQDVRVERALDQRLMQLSKTEREIWLLDYKINSRGIYRDGKGIMGALRVVDASQSDNDNLMRELTGGAAGGCTEVLKIKNWCIAQGVPLEGLAKDDVIVALADDSIPDQVRKVLSLRQDAGKTSTAKLRPMIDAASKTDGRIRGMFQYHGAGTGRWAGRRVQFHNFPRPKFDFDEIIAAIKWMTDLPPLDCSKRLKVFMGSPLDAISSCLRSFVMAAPGNIFHVADFSNIEGRGIAWLAGEETKLEAFRLADAKLGPPIYEKTASGILGIAIELITEALRQAYGKVPELACGFGGGKGAFQTMAKTYGVKVTDEQAEEIKTQWRKQHPNIERYWYALEEAALAAVQDPGKAFSAGADGRKCVYKMQGSFLWCLLPSKRPLCYPYPRIMKVKTPWGAMKDAVTYMTVVDDAKRGTSKIIPDPNAHGSWQRVSTYGGKLSENNTQAICRDLLAHVMLECEKADFPIVLHVHDEVVAEVALSSGLTHKDFINCCSSVPDWAAGFPVVAKGVETVRYRK